MRAIFFDLDGTLLDTLPDIHENLNGALRAYGYSEVSIERTRACIGQGAEQLVAKALPAGAEKRDACVAHFRQHYAACANVHTRPYAGAKEFLIRAKAMGFRLAVITNKSQDATQRAVSQFFPDIFDFVEGNSGAFPCKPDPALARYAALTLRVAPADCVFVGDGETDVLTAKNAGMHSVAVLWGYRTREQLEGVGARRFVNSYTELEKLLLDGDFFPNGG